MNDTSATDAGSDEPKATLPDITDEDAEKLVRALGKPVDRAFLIQRVSRITHDVVRLALQPKPQDHQSDLRRLARGGRMWVRQVEKFPAQTMLRPSNLEQMKAEVTKFCDAVDVIRRQQSSANAGAPRRRLLLQIFIGEMIGIAKRANVLPSTPGRAIFPERLPPPFFQFTEEALNAARRLVLSSSLTEADIDAALLAFSVPSAEALVKQIELVRGRTGDYRATPHGLSEWAKEEDATGG